MLISIHPDNPDSRKVRQVVDILKDGGVVILPTDTVYAFCCDLYHYKAFERICLIKGIKPEKANFSLLCRDLSNISNFTKPFDRSIYKLLNRAFPGAYTFILEASSEVPSMFRSRKKTIGLRIPDHKIIQDVIDLLGHPLVVTSIKAPDDILGYPTDASEIHETYGNITDLVVDGGEGHILASTVIDLTSGVPELIREGAGSLEILN